MEFEASADEGGGDRTPQGAIGFGTDPQAVVVLGQVLWPEQGHLAHRRQAVEQVLGGVHIAFDL